MRQDRKERADSLSSSDQAEFRSREDTLTERMDDVELAEEPSVIAGGRREGWTPISAIVLWRRMVGILGNANKIKDQEVHAKVFEHLIDMWNMLITVRRISASHISIFLSYLYIIFLFVCLFKTGEATKTAIFLSKLFVLLIYSHYFYYNYDYH